MFNQNSQFLSPWACWSRVGEFAHVFFECRSTTAGRTALTMREQEQDNGLEMTADQAEKRKRRKRGRKYSHALKTNNLPKFGCLRGGKYDLMTASIKLCDVWSIFTALNLMYLITHSVQGYQGYTYCGMLWKLLSVQHVEEAKGWLSAPTEPVC